MLLVIVLTILSLIFMYSRKHLISGIFMLLALMTYFAYNFVHIVPIAIVIKNGTINNWFFIWFILDIVLMIFSSIFAFTKKRKISLWFMWITVSILIFQQWNNIFTLFLIFKNRLF